MALTAGQVTPSPVESGPGLQYQHFTMNLKPRGVGVTLGIGRRTVPDPSEQFTMPPPPSPVSRAQFGGGGNARETMEGY